MPDLTRRIVVHNDELPRVGRVVKRAHWVADAAPSAVVRLLCKAALVTCSIVSGGVRRKERKEKAKGNDECNNLSE